MQEVSFHVSSFSPHHASGPPFHQGVSHYHPHPHRHPHPHLLFLPFHSPDYCLSHQMEFSQLEKEPSLYLSSTYVTNGTQVIKSINGENTTT